MDLPTKVARLALTWARQLAQEDVLGLTVRELSTLYGNEFEYDTRDLEDMLMWGQGDWEEYFDTMKREDAKQDTTKSELTSLVATDGMSAEERRQLVEMTVGKGSASGRDPVNPTPRRNEVWNKGAGQQHSQYWTAGGACLAAGAGRAGAIAVPTTADVKTFTLADITVTAGPFRHVQHRGRYTVLADLTNGSAPTSPVTCVGAPIPALAATLPGYDSFLRVDWPDMGVLPLSRSFWLALYDHVYQHGVKGAPGHLGIGCMAGLGRTGTALACIYKVATNCTGDAALAAVRSIYNARAVETQAQQAYLNAL